MVITSAATQQSEVKSIKHVFQIWDTSKTTSSSLSQEKQPLRESTCVYNQWIGNRDLVFVGYRGY